MEFALTSSTQSLRIRRFSLHRAISPPRHVVRLLLFAAICCCTLAFFLQRASGNPPAAQVIYTGIALHRVSDLNIEELTYTLDFDLWFRYQGDIPVEQIEFPNAAQPIRFHSERPAGDVGITEMHAAVPVAHQELAGTHYLLYRVKGSFNADFLSASPVFFREHIIGLSFYHRSLSARQLTFAPDPLFMNPENEEAFWKNIKETQILSAASGWKISDGEFFQDKIERPCLSDPEKLLQNRFTGQFSRFNAVFRIKKDDFTLRGTIAALQSLLPPALLLSIFLISGFLILLLVSLGHLDALKRFPKILWGLQTLAMSLLLLSSEQLLVNTLLQHHVDSYHLKLLRLVFELCWWLVGAFLAVLAIERFVWAPLRKRTQRPVSRLLRHSTAVIIYLLTFFGIVAFVFGQKVSSLIATSGIFAVILAFSNKIDISNIFAGIGISLSNPFRIDDWVKIGECEEGQVVDMTSRTTNVQTRDYSMLSIPNTTVAASVIENFNYPDGRFRLQFTLETEPSYSPERVQKILLDAVLSTDGVLQEPLPKIFFQGQGDSSAIYRVVFYIDDYSQKFSFKQIVWKRVWIHLERAGIGLATPRREILMIAPKMPVLDTPLNVLQHVDIFAPLSEEAKTTLSQRMRRQQCPAGETIVRQGETERKSLFILIEGAVGLWMQSDDGTPGEVARVGTGDVFGEMELLTGEARRFGAITLTDSVLYEIRKEDIAPFFQKHPELAERFSSTLITRQLAMNVRKDALQAQTLDKATLSSQLLENIERFFGLKETES